MVLETHARADHLPAAPFINAHTGTWIDIGAHIRDVQAPLPLDPQAAVTAQCDAVVPVPRLQGTSRDDYRWETTVGAQRHHSVHVPEGIDEDTFVATRESRDARLAVPRLLLPSIQVAIRTGRFPDAEANGVTDLRIPARWDEAAGDV